MIYKHSRFGCELEFGLRVLETEWFRFFERFG